MKRWTVISGSTRPLSSLPSITIEEPSFHNSATKQDSDPYELLLKSLSNSPSPCSDVIQGSACEGSLRELEPIPTASTFERWSQRYDISSSPNWIRSYMSPSNPLSLLTPAPIGTPRDLIQKASPRSIGSQKYGSRVFNFDNFLVD